MIGTVARALGLGAMLSLAGCHERASTSAKSIPEGPREVRATATEVKVCSKGGSDAQCRTIVPVAFTPPRADAFERTLRDAIPSDVRDDGVELFLVRHEGKRGEAIFGELYDVATSVRRARIALVADQHVDRVRYVGARVLTIACIDDGPGCVAALVDPHSGARTALEGNFHAIEPAATHLDGDRWAFVSGNGGHVEVRDVSTDAIVKRYEVTPHAGPEERVQVVLESKHALVLRFAGLPERRLELDR